MLKRKTATHKVLADDGGYRFMFYCDLSGAHICTTKKIYYGDTQEEALQAAWQAEGRSLFNQCRKCGKWVSLAMYNVDVLECVECAPSKPRRSSVKAAVRRLRNPQNRARLVASLLLITGRGGANESDRKVKIQKHGRLWLWP